MEHMKTVSPRAVLKQAHDGIELGANKLTGEEYQAIEQALKGSGVPLALDRLFALHAKRVLGHVLERI